MPELYVHVIDDEESVLKACAFLLNSMGYQYKTWSDSLEFLRLTDLHSTAVVITDLRMPNIDGEHLVQHLNNSKSTLGVIVLTGHGDVDTAVKLLKNGIVDFLQKPVEAKNLAESISTAWQYSLNAFRDWNNFKIYDSLNSKEKNILNLIVSGYSNKEAASSMHLSVRSIEVYRANLLDKFACKHLTQLVRIIEQLKDRYKI
ncbi:response regulator [Taylorella equigenitalis]|nr:response regulator [Taylorella equigenitalis]WEE00274.1 response regulator [Taylorella equigenitalis]WEE01751.1 response regulator [Taylorella equigenitalis]WFD79766.1 response regulator [Taylorella equigenitalis]WFD82721.1 response regulator [Taylorella equigenitalis]WFD99660.1 response regulator [Taylorella equigenitalis]